MRIKDYYKLLDLDYKATPEQIKKAYRQLAMRYHPDKNSGNQYAAAHFREVREAYHVLSDPQRRSAYNQQRWYRLSTLEKTDNEAMAPHFIIRICQDLKRYVNTLDP